VHPSLFRRHRGSAGTAYELALLLDHPKWLRDENISIVEVMGGLIPVEMGPGDTVFRIRLLPASVRDTSDVYIRVAGKVGRDDFSRMIRGDTAAPLISSIGGRPVIEVGSTD
jgi:hypothetical protein